ncbi:MAG: DMT family transporter [Eubacteriales bacterium]|nr:DMT family transporter [Eubacteriales bacterium]
MNRHSEAAGHLAAITTNVLWGTTFVSTKVLLQYFNPMEILLTRTVIGFLALCLLYPHPMRGTSRKQERTYALAGLTGTCLYYLLENIALTYTMASNVGVIIAVAPCFTAIMMHLCFPGEEKLKGSFFAGFFVALCGILLISFNGSRMQLNPLGDFLAVLATMVWAVYAVQTRKISTYGYNTVQNTRKTFAYGILFMIPISFFFDMSVSVKDYAEPTVILNLLYLGLGASAVCFMTWNFAVRTLGAIRTSVYIYMGPVISVVTSMIVLHEVVTPVAALGTVLTLAGLIISEGRWKKKE